MRYAFIVAVIGLAASLAACMGTAPALPTETIIPSSSTPAPVNTPTPPPPTDTPEPTPTPTPGPAQSFAENKAIWDSNAQLPPGSAFSISLSGPALAESILHLLAVYERQDAAATLEATISDGQINLAYAGSWPGQSAIIIPELTDDAAISVGGSAPFELFTIMLDVLQGRLDGS
ncbi:MAG: hypothetical protein IT326_02150, partial [Anaerolineae bacterium]|nr:hypothetical protein [Anaerolineae bacterium]